MGLNPLKNRLWIGIHRELEGEGRQKQTWKGPFWRKQENAAKRGMRLRGWRVIDSDGDAPKMPCAPKRTKGCANTNTAAAVVVVVVVVVVAVAVAAAVVVAVAITV